MTVLQAWKLGEPLTIRLQELATGKTGTSSIELGRIAWSKSRRIAMFEPAKNDLAPTVPLSPHSLDMGKQIIPADREEFDGLHGVFADSLPDGWGRLLVDREAEARGIRRSDLTPIDRLAIVGVEGMGALTYRPEAQATPESPKMDLGELSDAAQRILGEAEGQTVQDALDLRAALGGSGGARPKIVCQIQENAGENAQIRPATALPDCHFGHWMVKFTTRDDGPHAAETEYAYSLMAREAGIDMPETRLITTRKGTRFFAVRRFDRETTNVNGQAVLRRWHMLSASGALESEHRKFAFDYGTLLNWFWQITQSETALEEAFRRAAFNAMSHNRDDHGRQHSALLDIDDGGNWRWRISPAYDLTPSHGPGGEHSLAIAGAGKDISRKQLIKLAKESPIREARINDIIDQVADALLRWPEFAAQAALPDAATKNVSALHEVV
ncbi:type II toxin-antitoxin system HipA family toxin [Thalassospira sp. TSL5-1]|uniref:type II toxin-antitoxin system HipA family toxin n=1 Tax=Thalassospira sp. TSL5-1 TaxID=1544451 RepID=UPI0009FB564B|nr:type II toxin-antitoxin system HipA family toxin [Thalassospira sp. TSL5-1]